MGQFARYEATAGAPASPLSSWPANSRLRHDQARPTLLVFAHPKCPCTEAAIDELESFLASHRKQVTVIILFYAPSQLNGNWSFTDLRKRAASIPDATVLSDNDGFEAKQFGVKTSGQILLFDVSGRIVFRGGITPARGTVGPNVGLNQLNAAVNGDLQPTRVSPVYGCSLLGAAG